MPLVFVALGSNVEPERRIAQAARLLRQEFPDVRFSSCYRSAPVGFAGDPFLNAVARFTTPLAPEALLVRLHDLEEQCGRRREDARWAPRAMDLDILLYGAEVRRGAAFTVPRPDLLRRSYMLGPLAELAPDERHPELGQTAAELWRERGPLLPPLTRIDLDLAAASSP